MKIYGMMLVAAAIFFGGCASYEQLMTNVDKAETWKGKVEFAPEHARGKGPCFVLYGKYPTPLVYKEFIPVEPDKTYVYKVNFRTLDPELPDSGYMGLELYDENKHIIGHYNVQAYKDTESEVVSACKGDKFLTVKMIKNYEKIKYSAVAFNVKKDYSDLPNYDISPQCSKMIPDKDGNLRIELKAKLTKDDYVIIHDAARPILPQMAINSMLNVAHEKGNASLAIPCYETVIYTNDGKSGDKELDRNSIMRVQTPQAYNYGLMLELYERAEKENKHDFVYADLVLVHYGLPVYFSKGFTNNIKITRKEDIPLCKALMNFSEEELFS